MVTKQQLTERKRGKGGTLVRLVADPSSVYVVKDLMERTGYTKPDRVGIGPLDRGVAFGVELDEIELDCPTDPTPGHPRCICIEAHQS